MNGPENRQTGKSIIMKDFIKTQLLAGKRVGLCSGGECNEIVGVVDDKNLKLIKNKLADRSE